MDGCQRLHSEVKHLKFEFGTLRIFQRGAKNGNDDWHLYTFTKPYQVSPLDTFLAMVIASRHELKIFRMVCSLCFRVWNHYWLKIWYQISLRSVLMLILRSKSRKNCEVLATSMFFDNYMRLPLSGWNFQLEGFST